MEKNSNWITKIIPEICESLSLNLQGTTPIFPLDEFTELLKASLNIDSLSIKIDKMQFITKDKFYESLETKNIFSSICFSPLKENIHLIVGISDIHKLIPYMIEEDDHDNTILSMKNESIIKGLYTYFITEAVDAIIQTDVYNDFSIKMSDGQITALSAYSIDLSIKLLNDTLHARILIPNNLYKDFQSHYTYVEPTLANLENIPNVNIPMSINTGSIMLNPDEIKSLNEGDFLILHNSFYRPSEKKGSFQLFIGNNPIFQIKPQNDGIKILDFLYFYNEGNMDENDQEQEDFNDELDIENNLSKKGMDDHLDNENLDNENLDNENLDNENLDSEDLDSEDLDSEDLDSEDLDSEDLDSEDLDSEDLDSEDLDIENTLISPEKASLAKVPLTIQMEVARFTLSLEEIKKLAPGFNLPIKINPLQVNLIISGKSIGTGEIIEIGDTTGVRITKLHD